VQAPDLCGRFSGRVVRDVDTQCHDPGMDGASGWRVAASAASSALVDISNYVMFEFGRPSHIFDLDKIHERLRGALGPRRRDAASCSTADHRASTRRWA
jgi:phenylalanyl-tRNA synthetase beta chain